jgi:hypothetical protein
MRDADEDPMKLLLLSRFSPSTRMSLIGRPTGPRPRTKSPNFECAQALTWTVMKIMFGNTRLPLSLNLMCVGFTNLY